MPYVSLTNSSPSERKIVDPIQPDLDQVVSFFSYRFFRSYTYYSVAEAAYEGLTIAAFLMLLIVFIGESNEEQSKALL